MFKFSEAEALGWLDILLFIAVGLASVTASVILAVMFWQAPATIRAAYYSTATTAPTLAISGGFAAPTATSSATPTSMPSATHAPLPTPTVTRVASGPLSPHTSLGAKWIEIDLSEQKLTAFEGNTAVFAALVSTGVSQFSTPVGEYEILRKVRSQVMSGPDYYLPNVEFVSYFFKGYAMHGTYWHDNFGHPMSHGCINMRNEDAQRIYDWAPVGTPVRVRP